jgi:uncharacterized protein YyaL (SSP411 family)
VPLRPRHPVLIAVLFAPFALAAEPAVSAPLPPAAARAVDEQARLVRLCDQVAASYDTARGGFVDKAGVPSQSAVELALALSHDATQGLWKERALKTIDWTRSLMDTMSGGFVTRAPKSSAEGAAFETRTDVNGQRLMVLLSAWKETGDPQYKKDAFRVAGFMDRVLLDGRGGFVSAQVGDRELVPAANGVAIRSWLALAAVDGDPRIRDFSLRSIERVWETSFDKLGVLLRRGSISEVMEWPQLDDQVEMGRALLYAWRLCGRERDLGRAVGLGRVLLAKFEDAENGGFMTQARPKKDGTIRKAPRDPGENARAALFLAELSGATGDATFHEAGRRALAAFEKRQAKSGNGAQAAEWALAQRALLAPDVPERPAWRAVVVPPPTPRVIIFKPRKTGR